jgi:hypothetical protein
MAVFGALGVVLLLGVVLAVLGLRGVRTDDHPLCRRCRFDLTGRAPGSTRCPECGGNLSSSLAIVVGHRRRRRGPLVAGLAIVLPSLLVLGLLGWRAAANVDWRSTEPTWLLLRQAGSADATWRTPALREVNRRVGQFDTGRWDAVVAAATAYEADANRPWDTMWGNLFAPVTANPRPSPAVWAAYVDGLAKQATSSNGARRTAALDELLSRLGDSPVGDATRAAVVARGLDYQADLSTPWDHKWGDLLEQAHAAHRMTAAQWQRYATQAMPATAFGIRIRPRVRRGDPLPYWLDESGFRGPMMTSALRYRISKLELLWDGQPAPPGRGDSWSSGSLAGSGGASGSSIPPDEFPHDLPDGIQHVHLTAVVGVYATAANGDVDEHATPFSQRTVDRPATFDLLPADHPTVQVVHDPSLADAIRKSLKVEPVRQQAGSYAYVNVSVTVNAPPVGLAFHIVLVQAGKELTAGTLACPAHEQNHSYGTGGPGRLSGPTVDVHLRGDPAVAAGTVDAFSAWDGEVVFKDVPVTYR